MSKTVAVPIDYIPWDTPTKHPLFPLWIVGRLKGGGLWLGDTSGGYTVGLFTLPAYASPYWWQLFHVTAWSSSATLMLAEVDIFSSEFYPGTSVFVAHKAAVAGTFVTGVAQVFAFDLSSLNQVIMLNQEPNYGALTIWFSANVNICSYNVAMQALLMVEPNKYGVSLREVIGK